MLLSHTGGARDGHRAPKLREIVTEWIRQGEDGALMQKVEERAEAITIQTGTRRTKRSVTYASGPSCAGEWRWGGGSAS